MSAPTTEPVYKPEFEAIWDEYIPEVYKRADANLGWPMKRYFAALGNQVAGVSETIDRLTYIPANARTAADIDLAPTGELLVSTPETETISPNDMTQWSLVTVYGGLRVYKLEHQADGAYVEFNPYLKGGTYTMTFSYVAQTENGTVTVSIDDEDVATEDLQTSGAAAYGSGLYGDGPYGGTPSIITTYPVQFDIERGYPSIKIRFDLDNQGGDLTRRMNVGQFTVQNVKGGYKYATSDLVNPFSADKKWLPWLAQFTGVVLDQNLSEQDQRDAILLAYGGINAGTRDALVQAARRALTGTRYCKVFDHSVTNGIGQGGAFDVLLLTRLSETPDDVDIVQYVIDAGAKPAGVVLHHQTYSATWDAVLEQYPRWQDWDETTWALMSEAGLA